MKKLATQEPSGNNITTTGYGGSYLQTIVLPEEDKIFIDLTIINLKHKVQLIRVQE